MIRRTCTDARALLNQMSVSERSFVFECCLFMRLYNKYLNLNPWNFTCVSKTCANGDL